MNVGLSKAKKLIPQPLLTVSTTLNPIPQGTQKFLNQTKQKSKSQGINPTKLNTLDLSLVFVNML